MINSLRTKITLLYIFGLGLIIAIIILVLSAEVYENYRALFIQQGQGSAEQLVIKTERLIQLGLLPEELVGFDALCRELVDSTEGVVYAALINDQQLPLYQSELGVEETYDYRSDSQWLISVPLESRLHREYSIRVLVDMQLVHDKVSDLVRSVLFYAGAASLLVLLVTLVFLKTNMGRPIHALVDHISQVDAASVTPGAWKLPARKDEIGIVARAFDSLMERLSVSQNSLSQANKKLLALTDDLEVQVQNRTVELESVNRQLDSIARTDNLTGLPNRWFLDSVLEQRFDRAKRYMRPFAIMMVDLDGFKEVNDRNGHAAGDVALRTLGQRFLGSFRKSDSVFRIGGDEFIFLADEYIDRRDLCQLAEKIVDQIKAPVVFENNQLELGVINLGVSIGIASLTSADLSGKDLLARSDEAMYKAKKSGADYAFSDMADS